MKERAIALGGHLVIRSSPGKGTVIEVDVPLSTPPRRMNAPPSFLIADDHLVVRKGLTRSYATNFPNPTSGKWPMPRNSCKPFGISSQSAHHRPEHAGETTAGNDPTGGMLLPGVPILVLSIHRKTCMPCAC